MGFTDVGLLRISESIRAYAYLILSSQASARSSIVGNTVSALTAQSAFLDNFENVVNRRVDIWEDIKRYQDTLSYASSKVDYSVGKNVYMLPSNMILKIKTGTVRYNNKILVSDGKFILGKNEKVNSLETPVTASSAAASCFSKMPHCPTLKNGRQPVKRLPENVWFTVSPLRLAATNSSFEYISQATKNSGEILKQLDSQGISFFISINILGKSFAEVQKKANWLCRIEWHLWCMLL